MRILLPLVLTLGSLAGVGCGAAEADATALGVDTTLVVTSDPELRAMAAELLPGLAERAGMTLSAPVRIERRSRDDLEAYLRAKLDEELPEHRARRLARAYELLGLVSADTDLREVLLGVYREQVAGFYDPDSTALFVLDDQPAETLEPVLLHELVHAVQDQTVSLQALTDPALGNDRRTAAQAAIEGHATLVMLEFMMGRMGRGEVDLAEVPSMADQLRPALEAARDQYPALASAPRVLQEGLLFPYLEGAGYVLAAWQADRDRGAVLSSRLPTSTEQVLDPARALGDVVDAPVPLWLVPGEGTVLLDETLGMAELGILLEAHGGDPEAARGWGGDRWALIAPADGGEAGLVYAVAFDAAADRDAFVAALTPGLGGMSRRARLESRDVEGHAVALLRVGLQTPVTVTLTAQAPR